MSEHRPLILNAFAMSAVSHLNYGLWRHPDDQSWRYNELAHWTGLARTLEEGGFDSLFIADALGQLDTHGGSADASLRTGTQSPLSDPLLLVSAMAAVTQRLGIGVTVSTTYEHPYLLARKFTTLDHLSNGRIGWNIVTSQLDSAARNLGLAEQLPHDERYERADEFLDVVYKLWERSWDDDAVLRDRERGVYTEPSRVHPIGHAGRWYTVPGAHLSEPSPQRTPVLFQAGGSPRGQRFAGQHAELVFVAGANAAGIRRSVDAIKAFAAQAGRAPDAIRFVAPVAVVTGPDDAAAAHKLAEYRRYYDAEGAIVHYSASTGIDFSTHDLDAPIRHQETNANRSLLSNLTHDPTRATPWTLREALAPAQGFGRHKTLVGGPVTVADALQAWLRDTGTDGINLAAIVNPGSFSDFSQFVVPELRRRGLLAPPAANPKIPQTLRERLFGHAGLPPDHPGHRRAAARSFAPQP
ncbi:LLM class flavin-dependent oxidoreductase [Variovorax sp. J22G73]|uniref:LLM class flavin-dependent oxidoreductase n=1 Tax=unclassified Variovorax TaxID=663243 RepID=UPI002578BF78|nr:MULTISPECIES: LLM class flavin-dependent oxidoreductase [unclassified Variovorax]MDM0005808.1 LLM class flavin-dependent oxidoreductase [Variovorax sp. J22R203]MDM0099835.1 LLM class flavin-dependent oxidoreductase [Variovorax sp. J22G73]